MQIGKLRKVTEVAVNCHALEEDNEMSLKNSQQLEPFLKTSLLMLFTKGFLSLILIPVN